MLSHSVVHCQPSDLNTFPFIPNPPASYPYPATYWILYWIGLKSDMWTTHNIEWESNGNFFILLVCFLAHSLYQVSWKEALGLPIFWMFYMIYSLHLFLKYRKTLLNSTGTDGWFFSSKEENVDTVGLQSEFFSWAKGFGVGAFFLLGPWDTLRLLSSQMSSPVSQPVAVCFWENTYPKGTVSISNAPGTRTNTFSLFFFFWPCLF